MLNGFRFVGTSKIMQRFTGLLEKAAQHLLPVLLVGESGSGKDHAARLIHMLSRWKSGPFNELQVSRLKSGVAESTMFGHMKGSFTGAIKDFAGALEASDGGVLLINEFHRVKRRVQELLLPSLDRYGFSKIGSTSLVQPQVKVIIATARLPRDIIGLDEHLLNRTPAFPIFVPPLRDHMEDFDELFAHAVRRAVEVSLVKELPWRDDAIMLLRDYHWPGNVRQFQNVIANAMAYAPGSTVVPDDVISCLKFTNDSRHATGDKMEVLRRTAELCDKYDNHRIVAELEGCCTKTVERRLALFKKTGPARCSSGSA